MSSLSFCCTQTIPDLNIFGSQEDTRAPGGNTYRKRENMQIPQQKGPN